MEPVLLLRRGVIAMSTQDKKHTPLPPRDVKIIPPFVSLVDRVRALLGDFASALGRQNGSGYERSVELSQELFAELPELKRQIEILGGRLERWSNASDLKKVLLFCAGRATSLKSDLGTLERAAGQSKRVPREVIEPLHAILGLNGDIERLDEVVERMTSR